MPLLDRLLAPVVAALLRKLEAEPIQVDWKITRGKLIIGGKDGIEGFGRAVITPHADNLREKG